MGSSGRSRDRSVDRGGLGFLSAARIYSKENPTPAVRSRRLPPRGATGGASAGARSARPFPEGPRGSRGGFRFLPRTAFLLHLQKKIVDSAHGLAPLALISFKGAWQVRVIAQGASL